MVPFAARVVAARVQAENVTAKHVQYVISSAPIRSVMALVLQKRLEHFGRDARIKYEADIKSGRRSSAGGPLPFKITSLCGSSVIPDLYSCETGAA